MSEMQLCCLTIGGGAYVVDIRRIEEILPAPALTSLPRAPAFVEGIVRLRGDVIPVVDARKRLGVAPAAVKGRAKLIVCRVGRRRVGVLVDGVTHVLRLDAGAVRAAPVASAPGGTPFVLGVCGEPGALKLLLDVKALVSDEGAAQKGIHALAGQ